MKVKRVMYSIITTVLLLMGISSTVFADEDAKDVENTDFTVTMETGLDNVAVEGEAMPVTVTVGNTGKDFVGYLRVIIPASYSVDSLAYEKAVTIPSGGEKSISMLLPNVDEAAFLRIELETERGKILYSQQETFKSTTTGQNAVIGILSSDYSGLNYFDGISVDLGYGAISTKVLRLTEDNIPDTGKGLSVCDYILIDNYNTSQLSEEQRNAIASWVSDGGILIFGTGSKASTTLEGFAGMVPAVTTGGLTKQSLYVMGSIEEAQQVDVAELTADGWEDAQNSIASGGTAWKSSYGNGSILVLSYDLDMEPIVSWRDGRTDLAKNILQNAGNDQTYSNIMYGGTGNSYNDWEMEQAVNGTDRNRVPNALLYAGIFLIYVICIGPVMYLILKAKDKREKMWIVMPVIALGFTVIIYGTSMIYRIHKPFVDAVSIVNFNSGSKLTTTYMRVQSPKGKAYSVAFGDGYQTVEPWNSQGNASSGTTDYQCAVLSEGEAVQLNIKKVTAFTQQNLKTQKEEILRNGEGIQTDLICSINSIEGNVTNNTGYDLKNVVVCYEDRYVYLGHMKNGETMQIDPAKVYSLSYMSYDYSQWMEDSPSEFPFFNNSEREHDLKDNENVYGLMETAALNLSMNQGMVFGMIENYDSPLVRDNSAKTYEAAVAVTNFYQVAEEYKNYTTFVDDINVYQVGGDNIPYDSSYPQDYSTLDTEDRYLYGESELDVLYDFQTLDTIGAQLLNSDYGEEYDDNYEEYCMVQLYNYQTGQYDDVFTSDGTVTDLTPYLNEENWMVVRYYTDQPDAWGGAAPKLTLVGGEQ